MACTPVGWALTTVTEVKDFLGIVVATWDELFCHLINAASSFVEKSTDRRLVAWDWDLYDASHRENCWYDGNDFEKLLLRQYPINSVVTISISGDIIGAADGDDYYGSTGYLIYNRQGILFYGSGWTSGVQNVRASYNAGYAAGTPEREELRQLAIVLVAVVFQKKDKLAFKSERIGNYSYTKGDMKGAYELYGIPAEDILLRYKRKWGGLT